MWHINLDVDCCKDTFCMAHMQVVPLTAAVIVTTPQKLAFIDVAKGVRMFSKLKVCISVIQSPSSFLK